VSDLSF
jgi:hypothetical protein